MAKWWYTVGSFSLLLWLSLTALLTSLVIPATANRAVDLIDLRYGWPLWFVTQDQRNAFFNLGATSLPAVRPLLSPAQGPIDIRLGALGVNLLGWGMLFCLLLYGEILTNRLTGAVCRFHHISRQIAWWICVGFLITVSSLALPNKVSDNVQLIDMHYGWPITFIVQNQSRFPYGGDGPPLPQVVWMRPPLEDPTTFLAPPFWANIGIWSSLGWLAWWSVLKLTRRVRKVD